jgi:F0F1-type ATP synthase delta subunit
MITRMQVAQYVADQLPQKRRQALQEAAAWLVTTGRTREAGYLVRDVSMVLARDGYLAAQVTTARPIDGEVELAIKGYLTKLTSSQQIELIASVDSQILGGMQLVTPTAELDTTLRSKLITLASQGGQS